MAKLRHVAMSVPDPKKAAEFYSKVFDMEIVGETDSPLASGIYLSDGTISLALLNYNPPEPPGPSPRSRGLVIPSLLESPDADTAAAALAGARSGDHPANAIRAR